jgi:cytochrome c oxidase subunit II
MNARLRPATAAAAPALCLLLQGCGGWQSILDPASAPAREVASLWWIALGSTGFLALLVFAGLAQALRRSRRASVAREGGQTAIGENRFILLAGGVFPALFLIGFLAVSVRTGSVVSQPRGDPALVIEVVGHQYWWEVRYPEHGITTANEIHVPVGVPIEVRVSSADVIHSFWVPQLSAGKLDMVPGRTNLIWLEADHPGHYRGQCTEFCGVQHALMSLLVIASPEEEFEAWLAARAAPRTPPDAGLPTEGMGVFVREGCGACHAVEGVSRPGAAGNPGPDLTHLAGRRTLGALVIDNEPGHLADWIRDPHALKPGVRMPAHPGIGDAEMRALVAFLETLQ